MFVIVPLSSQSLRGLNQRKKKENTIQQCIWPQVSSRVTYDYLSYHDQQSHIVYITPCSFCTFLWCESLPIDLHDLCSSCVISRFPYCPITAYPYAVDPYEFILRFWTSASPVNSPCESVSGHVVCFRPCTAPASLLSQPSFAPFFRFSHHVLLTICQSQKSHRKSQTSITIESRSWLITKKEKTWLDQTMHTLTISVSSSCDVASVDPISTAPVTSSVQCTSSRALQTETLKISTDHLQQEHLNAAPLFSAGFDPDSWFCALQTAQTTKRNFHDIFANPVQ